MNHVDVIRQTETSIDDTSEHTLQDFSNDEKEVLLSEEWIGTTRFQILKMQLPEEYTCVNGRPTKVSNSFRPDTIWPKEWTKLSKKQEQMEIAVWDKEEIRLQEARRKRIIFDVSSEDKRTPQGDL